MLREKKDAEALPYLDRVLILNDRRTDAWCDMADTQSADCA